MSAYQDNTVDKLLSTGSVKNYQSDWLGTVERYATRVGEDIDHLADFALREEEKLVRGFKLAGEAVGEFVGEEIGKAIKGVTPAVKGIVEAVKEIRGDESG